MHSEEFSTYFNSFLQDASSIFMLVFVQSLSWEMRGRGQIEVDKQRR